MLPRIELVNITGAVEHSLLWLTASTSDVVIPNPNFKATQDLADGIVVYCIHGTADRTSSFHLIVNRMLAQTPSAISNFYLPAFDSRLMGIGIDDFAKQLAEKIRANGHKNVIIMGHSRGGLVAAYYAEYLAAADQVNVHAIIPICTPFGGSALAIMPLSWLSTSVKQMAKNSDFLRGLASRMLESQRQYFPVSAERDPLVLKDSVCIPEHKDLLFTLDRHGHLSIMTSHRLVNYIRLRLAEVCARVTGQPLEVFVIPPNQRLDDERKELEIDDACFEIDAQVEKLQARLHLHDAKAKIDVFVRLRGLLGEMLEGDRGEAYPQANTIGDFIRAYLDDPEENFGVKPIDVLREQLNYPLTIFNYSKTGSELFVEKLIDRYQQINLPPRQTLVPVLT